MIETDLSKYFDKKYIDEKIKQFSNANRKLNVEEFALINLMKKYLKSIDDERYYELCEIEMKQNKL